MTGIYRKLSAILIMSILLVASTLIVIAEDEVGIKVYNTELVTNDLGATYLEGEVPVADGQDIVVVHGIETVARKTMPETGQPAQFRIKIPASQINEEGVTSLRVKATAGKTVEESLPVRAEITYKARKEQTIKTASEEYELTLPGLQESVKAKASSGSDVYYSSSNPDVVDVDEDGNLLPKGPGKAKVSVKTIGSSRYNGTEKSVAVNVDEIDAYSVTFHSSTDEGDETTQQIINLGDSEALDANQFENGDHEFLGWATEDGGMMEYSNTATVTDLAGKGENTDLYAVWSGDGINAAIAWAVNIANDDSFSYGKKPATSSEGCYFCGTNQRRKPKGYEKTYVCMTFITAAYAHGAEDPEMLAIDRAGSRCLTTTDTNFSRYSCWQKVGLAKNLSVNDLQPGDVICHYSGDNKSGHLSMYIGNNTIVDAEGIKDCWGPNSIAVRSNYGSRMLRGAARHSGKSYVMRYVGPKA